MSTLPIVFDDGTAAHVPQEKVADAIKDGGKVVQSMKFDDGSSAYVTLDRVHDAIRDGGTVIGAAPVAPHVNMETMAAPGLDPDSPTTIPLHASPAARQAYNPANTGPLGDLIGGKPGAFEQSADVDLMTIPEAAAITGAGAAGAPALGAATAGAWPAAKQAAPALLKQAIKGAGLGAGYEAYRRVFGGRPFK